MVEMEEEEEEEEQRWEEGASREEEARRQEAAQSIVRCNVLLVLLVVVRLERVGEGVEAAFLVGRRFAARAELWWTASWTMTRSLAWCSPARSRLLG